MNETVEYTLLPMDSIRLRFYYALMSYSIGLISFVSIQKPFIVLVGDLFIIMLTPLTLLITDPNNIHVELSITILFPVLTLLFGIFQGYLFIRIYDYYFHKKDIDKNDDEDREDDKDNDHKKTKKCNTIAHYCKACLIAATIMSICIFYIIDLTIPFLVSVSYPNIYLKIRVCIHLFLSVFLIGLAIGFKQQRFGKLWIMVAYSTTTMLLTTLFLFKIIKKNGYYVYLTFVIHFIIIIITVPIWIIFLYKFIYKILIKKYLFPYITAYRERYYENIVEHDDATDVQLNVFTTTISNTTKENLQ